MVIGLRGCVFVLDVVRGVMVHTVEVVRALNERGFLWCELGEAVAELLPHAVGVLAEVDWVGEPGDGEFKLAFAGFNVFRIFRVPGLGPVTCMNVS